MKRLKMYPHGAKGRLITFCGLDGCGKSSMIASLAEVLEEKGVDFVVCRQPTEQVRKSEIFRAFMDCPDHSAYDYRSLSMLAAADRIQHSNRFIMDNLRQGKVVISDRYFYSCYANLLARGFKKDAWILDAAKYIPQPDHAFFLDVPAELAISRVRKRPEERDRYVDVPLQFELREMYLKIAAKNDGSVIKSDKDPKETFAEIKNIIGLI